MNESPKSRMRVLHLEDNENDQILVQEMLRADGFACEMVVVQNERDFKVALERQPFDLIISDFSLPSGNAIEALAIAREQSPQTPFIFFSGTIGEEAAVETLKQGASDYVLKQRPKRLTSAVRAALRGVAERARVREMETEMRELESQLLRAQRMESLGSLVGGIAHDLNNALVPIIIGVELLQRENLSRDGDGMLQAMESSARRSAEMVRQMLLFARGGENQKVEVRPGQLVKEISNIISETFPKSIRCHSTVDPSSSQVLGVPTQLHQVLMNLCVNARDAMPRGGALTLSVENAKVDAALALRQGVEPGNYLTIAVADTGDGISPEVMDKIFQPFFTTKGVGKGTGLGLSTVRSIVKSHGGFLIVRSHKGEGSEFKVFLPASSGPAPVMPGKKVPPSGSGERILVVDDEETVLAIARAALQNFGYKVVIAAGGIEAVSLFTKHPDIQLVISDLAMPLMNGRSTIAEIRKFHPDIKVIIASGTEKELEESLPHIKADGVIHKPFTSEDLLETVHRVLTKAKG